MNNDFKEEIKHIEIPKELTSRAQMGIQIADKERSGKRKKKRYLPVIAASFALITVVSFASFNEGFASMVKGYFMDIKKWNGTVVGTEYSEASKEIVVSTAAPVQQAEDIVIPVTVEISDSTKPPYGIIEVLSIEELEISDANGKVLDSSVIQINSDIEVPTDFDIENTKYLLEEITSKGDQTRVFQADIILPKDKLLEGKVFLKISSFYGLSKADAPLEITGHWQVETE